MNNKDIAIINDDLVKDIRSLTKGAKGRVARVINGEMSRLYWNIGKRIRNEILKEGRAEYEEQVVKSLAKQLSAEYGQGFSRISLIRMIQFYDYFSNIEMGSALSNQLSWSHIIELLPLKEHSQREFYAYMAIHENWSVRELRSKIHKMTYERTIGTQKAGTKGEEMISLLKNENKLNLDLVPKDPLILDFLHLPEYYTENELENAILEELEKFILELGHGFSLVARQKRLSVGSNHFWLDLLFYHRRLKRLVAVKLKLGKFQPKDKNQMELYLNWLRKHGGFEGEESPIGIVLCTEKSHAQIEFVDLTSDIHMAKYWAELPPAEILEKKIQEIVLRCREKYSEKIIVGTRATKE